MANATTILRAVLALLAAFAVAPSSATAASPPPSFLLSCDNGHSYPIVARAVSDRGDLVTGFLFLAPRRAVHIRLIPMGVGYRYAARGIWLDGWRGTAVLHLGKHVSTVCAVLPGGQPPGAVQALAYSPQ